MTLSFLYSFAAFTTATTLAIEIPAAVQQHLEMNVTALNPLKIEWTQHLESPLPLNQLLEKIKDTNRALLLPSTITYAISGSRFYHHEAYKTDVNGKIRTQRQHSAFDGVKFRSGSDESNRHNTYVIDTRERFLSTTDPQSFMFYTEYFDAAGFRFGNRVSEIFSGPASQVLSLIEQGAELTGVHDEVVSTQECRVVTLKTTETQHQYWLAPSLGYAVLRHQERNPAGKLLNTTENSLFERIADSQLWLPIKCRVDYHTWHRVPDVIEDSPFLSLVITVKHVGRDEITDSLFVIDTTKGGSRVSDSTIEGEKDEHGFVNFTIPATEVDLLRPIRPRQDRTQLLLILFNAAIALCFAGWFIFRRRLS